MYANLDVLKTYADGDVDFLKEMITKFNNEIPAVLERLDETLEKRDWANLQQIAHKMIGTTGVFHINEITPVLQKIEKTCMEAPNQEVLRPMVEKVRTICESAMTELETEKEKL